MIGIAFPRLLKVLRPTLVVILAAILLMPLLPGARAATTPGITQELVNVGQFTRDASSAIPVIGFNLTSTGGETLDSILVEFVDVNGFNPGDDEDLRRVDTDSAVSGVGLYRDDGALDDVLDAGDTSVTIDDVMWTGSDVFMDFAITNSEPVPTTVTGAFHWFIVIRTSENPAVLDDFDAFRVRIPIGGIVATDGVGTIAQPPFEPVTSDILTVLRTRTVDMTGGDDWIGPASVAVNSLAVLGLRLVDGGIATNYGIDDRIANLRVDLTEDNGILTTADLQPLTLDGATSGLALYRDDGTDDDVWDAADTAVVLADIQPRTFFFGGATFNLVPQAPGLAIPDSPGGEIDLFLAVRSANIVTGDAFRLEVEAHRVTVEGTLAAAGGTIDGSLTTPMEWFDTVLPSGLVQGDSTPPQIRNARWTEDSGFLFAQGLNLWFGPSIPDAVGATAEGEARDDESGLALANYSVETGLALSPPDQPLSGSSGSWDPYDGTYLIDASSTDVDSPAVVTIYDMVGNSIATTALNSDYAYTGTNASVLILPSPGWTVPLGTQAWVDPNSGKLWFSNLIPTMLTLDLTVDLVALSGAGLKNATASTEASLAGGPRPGSVVYAPTPDDDTWSNAYDLDAGSLASGSPVTIWAEDNIGNAASMEIEYGLDALGPRISFLTPGPTDVLTGEILVRVNVTDAETGVNRVELAVDANSPLQAMFFDGESYFFMVSTVLFTDGTHRIIVRAEDMVSNVQAIGMDVEFNNAVDTTNPVVIPVTPPDGAASHGTVVIQVFASDPEGIENVTLSLNGIVVTMPYNVDTGYYEYVLDSTQLADGAYQGMVTGTDMNGRTTSVMIDLQVANTVPPLDSLLAILQQNALLLLILALVLMFVVGTLLYRRQQWKKVKK